MSLDSNNTGSKRKAAAALEGQFDDSDEETNVAKKVENVKAPEDKTTTTTASKETKTAAGKFARCLVLSCLHSLHLLYSIEFAHLFVSNLHQTKKKSPNVPSKRPRRRLLLLKMPFSKLWLASPNQV